MTVPIPIDLKDHSFSLDGDIDGKIFTYKCLSCGLYLYVDYHNDKYYYETYDLGVKNDYGIPFYKKPIKPNTCKRRTMLQALE